MNGKMVDVLIKDSYNTDTTTGLKVMSDQWINVFADAGLLNVILGVDGVVTAFNILETECFVRIDIRYDRDFVKSAIKAAILIGKAE